MRMNILPKHFYSQIPDIAELKKERYWRTRMSMTGVNGADTNEQAAFLQNICSKELSEEIAAANLHEEAIKENGETGGYGTIECEVLYCFIASQKPKRIVQAGCGVSTSIILKAAADVSYTPEIICVEPYPTAYLQQLHDKGKIKLLQQKAQLADEQIFTLLGSNDLLFVDSTHTVKPGSEVNKIILEIMPCLQSGVWVHFHDIFFPYDYTRNLLSDDIFFWSETSLLHAFLTGNNAYEIKLSMSMLHYDKPELIKKLFPHYNPQANDEGLRAVGGKHFPCSLFLKVK